MKTIFLLGIIGLLLIAGCVYSPGANEKLPSKASATITPSTPPTISPSIAPAPSSNTNMANPASVYCIDKGGKLDIVDAPEGQIGICTLKDGTKCEEWSFFRGECLPVPPKECPGSCPQLMPPSPDFCRDGKIISGGKDVCGCQLPPKCETVACTMDAKICPDGSAVGRIGPNCEFAPCPGV